MRILFAYIEYIAKNIIFGQIKYINWARGYKLASKCQCDKVEHILTCIIKNEVTPIKLKRNYANDLEMH